MGVVAYATPLLVLALACDTERPRVAWSASRVFLCDFRPHTGHVALLYVRVCVLVPVLARAPARKPCFLRPSLEVLDLIFHECLKKCDMVSKRFVFGSSHVHLFPEVAQLLLEGLHLFLRCLETHFVSFS